MTNSSRLDRRRDAKKMRGISPPRSVLNVVSRIASPLIIAVVIGEAIHHCVERGIGHALETSRSDEYSALRSHVAGSDPKVLAFIVEFAGGGLVDFFHRFYPLSFCIFIIAQGAEFVNPFLQKIHNNLRMCIDTQNHF